MSTDRWLFPGPRTSREVSMFIMMILIILLTRPSFFVFRHKNVALLHSEQEQIT